MSFVETIARARALLEQSGRISLRVLQREFALDDAALEELASELVDVQQVAAREGKVLAWLGATGADRGAGAAPAETEAGERRQLTVLFCDLVGSTELAERLDPEDWQAVLRAYQERAGELITYHGGHVAQYLGDGLLVYFGWPRSFDDAAERAVRAGLGLEDAAATVEAGGAPLAVRVGPPHGPGGGERARRRGPQRDPRARRRAERGGARDEARSLLAPVCGWFTEGFDTLDLSEREGAALRARLSAEALGITR